MKPDLLPLCSKGTSASCTKQTMVLCPLRCSIPKVSLCHTKNLKNRSEQCLCDEYAPFITNVEPFIAIENIRVSVSNGQTLHRSSSDSVHENIK